MMLPKRGKPKPDRAHMARVAALPCVICGWWPVQVHHVCHGRYSQARAPDTETIPLCDRHYDELHSGKRLWAMKYGEDHTYLERVRAELEKTKCREV